MRLIKLSSDNPKFRTLEFKSGINILAGRQLTKAEKQTYNGIGKSFSLYLIHLIFGAQLDKSKAKEKKIYDFLSSYGAFYLEFKHKGKEYVIRKDFSDPGYNINGEKITRKDYAKELRRRLIGGSIDSHISFKQLLNVFARRYGGTYYSDILTQQGMPSTDYNQMYVNLSLLGIDTHLIQEKSKVKDKLNQLEKARDVIEGYESLLEESNIKDLKDELNALVEDKKRFIIAENYDKLKEKADSETEEINVLRNSVYEIRKKLLIKKKSLDQAEYIDIDIDKVLQIYDEANFYFSDQVASRLEQANEFHLKLLRSRVERLTKEITELRIKEDGLLELISDKEKVRDSVLKDLDSKGALEEYNSINDRIRTIEEEIRDLEKYKNILEGFKKDESNLALENAEIHRKGVQYLDDITDYLDELENKFRNLVKSFYKNHGGTFRIINTKDAKYLFNISAHIPRDGSQGVNEVKIFCYDILLYLLNKDLLGFVAHDGSIFSEMDPRQKSMIFKVALKYVHENDLQYFVNIGQASLNEVLDKEEVINILTDDEKEELEKCVILELYDKDPSNWLFGTSFG